MFHLQQLDTCARGAPHDHPNIHRAIQFPSLHLTVSWGPRVSQNLWNSQLPSYLSLLRGWEYNMFSLETVLANRFPKAPGPAGRLAMLLLTNPSWRGTF